MTAEQARTELKRILTPGNTLYIQRSTPRKVKGYREKQVLLSMHIIDYYYKGMDGEMYHVPYLRNVNALVVCALTGVDTCYHTDKKLPDYISINDTDTEEQVRSIVHMLRDVLEVPPVKFSWEILS